MPLNFSGMCVCVYVCVYYVQYTYNQLFDCVILCSGRYILYYFVILLNKFTAAIMLRYDLFVKLLIVI